MEVKGSPRMTTVLQEFNPRNVVLFGVLGDPQREK